MFLPSWSGRLLLKELEMPPAHIATALLAIALWVAPCFAVAVSAAGEPAGAAIAAERTDAAPDQARPDAGGEDWRNSFTATLARARALLQAGYERAPVLVIALGAFVALPGVALVSFLGQAIVSRRSKRAAIRAAQLRAGDAEPTAEMPTSADILPFSSLWSHEAWLTVEGGSAGTLPLDSRLIRIGRHQDNDVQLPDTTVHHYHAVIERTPDEAFVIIDLSGKEGNGVRVNGERQARAQLVDGDVIELGRTRLKFESAPA
jgi:hypothetical protein